MSKATFICSMVLLLIGGIGIFVARFFDFADFTRGFIEGASGVAIVIAAYGIIKCIFDERKKGGKNEE